MQSIAPEGRAKGMMNLDSDPKNPLGLNWGKIGDRVRRMETMHKDTESPSKNKLSSGVCGFLWGKFNPVVGFIPADKLESQDILRCTLR